MRLWSIHPKYLDPQGLVAVWREGLLALNVLQGNSRGYAHHPQLRRFQAAGDPVKAMKCYLWHVYLESKARGYKFDSSKLGRMGKCIPLEVTHGQLTYEMDHLKKKLKRRNPEKLKSADHVKIPQAHPLFVTVEGGPEEWEKVANRSRLPPR